MTQIGDFSAKSLINIPLYFEVTKLYLNSNFLTSCKGIGRYDTLTFLDLSQNSLTELSPEISQLTRLTYINLSNNFLSGNVLTYLKGLPLTIINLSFNNLTSIQEIGDFPECTYLGLSENQLENLPPGIGKLTCLKSLLLNRNQLTRLPLELGNLTSLIWLNLKHNCLTSLLPFSVGQRLTQLQSLNIAENPIRLLPRDFPDEEYPGYERFPSWNNDLTVYT